MIISLFLAPWITVKSGSVSWSARQRHDRLLFYNLKLNVTIVLLFCLSHPVIVMKCDIVRYALQ